jgi:WD40 repeat protein
MIAYEAGGSILLRDIPTAKEVGRLELAEPERFGSLRFTSDGKTLVSGSTNASTFYAAVRIWDVEARKPRFTFDSRMVGHTGMDLSRDGKMVALGTAESTIRLLDAGTGKELFTEFQGHDAPVKSLVFGSDGKNLITSDDNGQVCFWDTTSSKEVRGIKTNRTGLALSPDGKRFVTDDFHQTIQVWDCDTGAELVKIKRPEDAWIKGLALSRDGKELVSLNWMKVGERSVELIVWDAGDGKQIRHISLPEIDLGDFLMLSSPQALALTPDGQTAFLGNGPGGIHRVDLEDGQQTMHLAGHKSFAGALVLSEDGKTLLSGSVDHSVRVWDLIAGQEVATLEGGRRAVHAVAFAPGGRLAASAGGAPRRTDRGDPDYPYDDVTDPLKIHLWDLATGKEVTHFEGHQADVTALAFSPDGKQLVSGQRDGTVLVWDLTSLRRLPVLDIPPGGLKALWDDLASSEAGRAHRAAWTLANQAEKAVPFLQEHVQPVVVVDAEQLRRWIRDLDSDSFAARSAAVKELEKLGEQAAPALRQSLAGNPSAELRKQAETLLGSLNRVHAPEVLQRLRAIQVLERIGSPQARQVLQQLANGAPAARETRDARTALARLAHRS